MSENYAIINGKRVELTDEEVVAIEDRTRKGPFERLKSDADGCYYYITEFGNIKFAYENRNNGNEKRYKNVNYFNNKDFAEQVALHQLLYRKLLKFKYDNGYKDTQKWNGKNMHYAIRYSYEGKKFIALGQYDDRDPNVYFPLKGMAEQAIEEVVEPFMKEHPEFVW